MRSNRRLLMMAGLLPGLALTMVACGSGSEDSDESDLTQEGIVCQHEAAFPNEVLNAALKGKPGALDSHGNAIISNFTAWPVYQPDSQTATIDPNVIKARTTATDARANIASRFGNDCSEKVATHLEKSKPNVYIYFTGYGDANQNNSLVDEGAILRWINERDPKALIFAINWNCEGAGDPWCAKNATSIGLKSSSPEYKSMSQSLNALSDEGPKVMETIKGFSSDQQKGYDSALSHAMQLGAQLIDQLLVADQGASGKSLLGNIHLLGYSMGAHAAAQILVQDFTDDASVGFKWTRPMCENGGSVCTVAELKKVKWSLGMGLSGWSDAMQSYNAFDASGVPARDDKDLEQYRNGGLLRISAPRYHNKLNVFNRRMDPTGNSDDTFERALGDILFGDYNHYSHDYSVPMFLEPGFVRLLDAFLEAPSPKDEKEIGVVYDNAGLMDFDDCPQSGGCEASSNYLAHAVNRSHQTVGIPESPKVPTVDGVPHAEKGTNKAVTFASSDAVPIALRTFDQEDLRGGVEMQFRPKFDVAADGVHGLFSYGSCQGSNDDLMPQAYFEDGELVFTMNYQGKSYEARVNVGETGIKKGQWSHLAFTWELPVASMTVPHTSQAEADASKATMAADVQKHQMALILANGLRKPLATTYKRQQGMGFLRIYVNGDLAVEGKLGTPDSTRECLSASEVVSSASYKVNGETYPPYNPYAGYDAQTGDLVSLGPGQELGTKCKAYKVRNEQAFFGCAKAAKANAAGDMDDIVLVWGPGREEYHNIKSGTGAPQLWPIGVGYNKNPFRVH